MLPTLQAFGGNFSFSSLIKAASNVDSRILDRMSFSISKCVAVSSAFAQESPD